MCLCWCKEPETGVEVMLMNDVEIVDDQHQQLTELLDLLQTHNTQLRQLVKLNDDNGQTLLFVDNSALMSAASLGE